MNIIRRILTFFYTLRGGMYYRIDNYGLAKKCLEKAIQMNSIQENIMLFQYYGHTLFRLKEYGKCFPLLKRSYEKYENDRWTVSNQEEYRLALETLSVLEYLSDHLEMKIDNFSSTKSIIKRNKD